MPTAYNQNAPSKLRAATGKPPVDIFSKHGKDTLTMDTKPFGDAPAANPPPAPPAPPPAALAARPVAANPPPVAPNLGNAPPPPTGPAANASPADANLTPDTPPAPQVPAQATAPVAPHMPKVENITKGNPKGEAGLGDNSVALDERREKLNKQISGLGATAGQGANSRVELAVLICQAASEGVITDSKEDVEQVYILFRDSLDKARMDDRTIDKDIAAKDPKALKSQVSKLRAFVKLGAANTKAASILTVARTVLPALGRDSKFKSAYDALREVCKAQMERFKENPKSKLLTKKEIETLLRAEQVEKEEETTEAFELRKIDAAIKAIKSVLDGVETADYFRVGVDSPEMKNALHQLQQRRAQVEPIVAQQKANPAEAE